MPLIKFSISDEAAAYLRWLARNILFVKSEDAAAKHLMAVQLGKTRRKYRREEPAPEDLVVSPAPRSEPDSDDD